MCSPLWLLVLKSVVRQCAAPCIFRVVTALFFRPPAWKTASAFLALKSWSCSITTQKMNALVPLFLPHCLIRCFNHKGQMEKHQAMTGELSVLLSAL